MIRTGSAFDFIHREPQRLQGGGDPVPQTVHIVRVEDPRLGRIRPQPIGGAAHRCSAWIRPEHRHSPPLTYCTFSTRLLPS